MERGSFIISYSAESEARSVQQVPAVEALSFAHLSEKSSLPLQSYQPSSLVPIDLHVRLQLPIAHEPLRYSCSLQTVPSGNMQSAYCPLGPHNSFSWPPAARHLFEPAVTSPTGPMLVWRVEQPAAKSKKTIPTLIRRSSMRVGALI
jgi:hypothetical protein